MKIIDFERKGNLVRFYLGKNDDKEYSGSNWNRQSYESYSDNNKVDDAHITGIRDIAFPFDAIVCEPSSGHRKSRISKNDMKNRKVPCIIVMTPELIGENDYLWTYANDFNRCLENDKSIKFYFGDQMNARKSTSIYHLPFKN